MGIVMSKKALMLNVPHKETENGAFVQIESDMQGLMNVMGNGNISVCQRNLFDKNAITAGVYINSSGGLTSSSVWNVTDYMPVKGVGSIRYWRTGSSGNAPQCAWYNADKSLNSVWKHLDTNGTTRPDGVVKEVPSDAAYLRMSIYNGDGLTTGMVIAGNGAITAYEPFVGTTGTQGTRKQFRGLNNVWSDSGDVSVEFWMLQMIGEKGDDMIQTCTINSEPTTLSGIYDAIQTAIGSTHTRWIAWAKDAEFFYSNTNNHAVVVVGCPSETNRSIYRNDSTSTYGYMRRGAYTGTLILETPVGTEYNYIILPESN